MPRLATLFATIATAVVLGLSIGAAAADDLGTLPDWSKDVTIDQARIGAIVSRSVDMKVSAWVDRADATYAPGDSLSLFVKPDRDAYVTVLDVGTSGRVSVLFPNAHQPDGRIDGHRVVRIGGEAGNRLRVEGPTGRNILKVIASDKPLDLVPFAESDAVGPFRVLRADTAALAARISAHLARQTHAAISTRTAVIRIVPRAKLGDR